MDENYNFVERTQKNLQKISDLLRDKTILDDDFYDFTNLINSCLGLISYVYEYTVRINVTLKRKERLEKVLNSGTFHLNNYGKINICKSMDKKGSEEKDLPTLLYHMRNAICHGHVQPYTQQGNKGTIIGAEFWDENKKGRSFEIKMSIDELTSFANDIANTYNSYLDKSKNS